MASSGNQHCANCIGTLSFAVPLCYRQVHGIVYDTLEFVRRILSVEINSATDNPVSLLLCISSLPIQSVTHLFASSLLA